MTEQLQAPELGTSTIHEMAAKVLAMEINPHLERARTVADAIDPDHVLPEVDIVPDPRALRVKGSLVQQKSLILHNGVQVGICTLASSKSDRTRWFHGITVNEQGRGFGSAAYKAAITQSMADGYDFRTEEWSQTEGARKVWERLAEQGVARVVRPFEPDGNGNFTGTYIIDAEK